MLRTAAVAMSAALILQSAYYLVYSNELASLSGLGVPIVVENALSEIVLLLPSLGIGFFLILIASPIAGSTRVATSIAAGGYILLADAAVRTALLISSLTPSDPIREAMSSRSTPGPVLEIFFASIFSLSLFVVAVFAVFAGRLAGGIVHWIGLLVAALLGLVLVHDVMSFVVDHVYDPTFDPSLPGAWVLGELWIEHKWLLLRISANLDAAAKLLFSLMACLIAWRLARVPASPPPCART